MKKRFMKTWIVGVMIGVLVGMNVSFAQSDTQAECSPSSALVNWDTFLSAVISSEGIADYWKETLGLYNNCQLTDITNVQNQIDGLENQIRQSFYSCNNTRVDELKPKYQKLRAELYYVRNFVDTKDGAFVAVNEKKLVEDMVTEFSTNNSYISEGSLRQYFEEFKKKYADRLKTYESCKVNRWKEVSDKWKELEKNMKALKSSFETTAKAEAKVDSKSVNSSKNAPKNKGGSFLSKVFSATINKKDPSKSLEAVARDFQKLSPDLGGPTFSQVTNTFASTQKTYAEGETKEEMLNRYQVLYKQSGDEAFDELIKKMNVMNTVIKESLPILSKLGTCSQQVAGRQCK